MYVLLLHAKTLLFNFFQAFTISNFNNMHIEKIFSRIYFLKNSKAETFCMIKMSPYLHLFNILFKICEVLYENNNPDLFYAEFCESKHLLLYFELVQMFKISVRIHNSRI